MRHGGWVRDERLHTAQRFTERAHTHSLEQKRGIGERSSFEGNHGSEAGHLAFREFILRMVIQSGIENFSYFLVPGKKIGDAATIAIMLQHAHG